MTANNSENQPELKVEIENRIDATKREIEDVKNGGIATHLLVYQILKNQEVVLRALYVLLQRVEEG